MFSAYLIAEELEPLAAELNHSTGDYANQIIVCPTSGHNFKIRLFIIEEHLFQYSRILKMDKRPVNGCAARLMAGLPERLSQRLGLEQAGMGYRRLEDHRPLGGELEFRAMKVSSENRTKRLIGCDRALSFGRHPGNIRQNAIGV